jgi:hypothetical protein
VKVSRTTIILTGTVSSWYQKEAIVTPDAKDFRHVGQFLSLLGLMTRGAGSLLDFLELLNHFQIDLDWKIFANTRQLLRLRIDLLQKF